MSAATRGVFSVVGRYGLAVLAVVLAALLRWQLQGLFGQSLPLITFYPVVALSAILGGAGPGILATLLSTVAALLWFMNPSTPSGATPGGAVVGAGLFCAAGVLVTVVAQMLRRSRQREHEAQVRQLEADARHVHDQALYDSAQRFRAMIEAVPSLTFEGDSEGNNTFASPQWCAYTGMTPEETAGWGWTRAVHPEDREASKARWSQAVRSGSPVEIQHRLRGTDGLYRWFMLRALPARDSQGRITRWAGSLTDVDGLVRTQEALRASEEFNRRLIASSYDCIKVLDMEGNLLLIGEGGRRLMEIEDVELYLNRPYMQFWQEEDRPMVEKALAAAMAGEVGRFEGYSPSVTGKPRWWDVRVTPIRGAGGRPERLLVIARDTTEAKQAEQAMRRSEELYRAIARNIPGGGVCVVDRDLRCLALEGTLVAAAARVGLLREGLGQRPLPEILGEDLLKVAEPRFRRALAGETNSYETEFQTEVGRRVILAQYLPLRDPSGDVMAAMVLSLDITQRKQAEEALRDALGRLDRHMANSPLGIIEWDGEFRITAWNPAAERLFGWSAEQALGLHIEVLPIVHEEDWPSVRQVMHDMGSGARPSNINCNRNRRRDGSVIECEWHNSALRDENGKLRSVLSMVADVTERNRIERELAAAKLSAERAMAAAKEANRAKDHFLAVLSHELRTPLTPVLTTAHLLRVNRQLPPDCREDVDTIERNVELEARLIDDLLDVTRIARGKIELDKRPVEFCEVVRRAVEVCQADIEARGLHFSVDLGDIESSTVHADPARLQQVFWNLIKNAIKFTPHGGCVGIRCWRQGETHVVAEVSDSGEGIDPALLPHIFNAFEQGGPTVTRQFGGLGLGLAITRGLVQMHGGTVQAFSEGKGKGATFQIKLPLHRIAGPEAPAGAPKAPLPTRSLRILLVEDHGDTARIMRRLLMADGHEVQTAGDVATALDLATREPFDLLLSDLGLPDRSGLDLVRELRSRGQNLPAIALSGYGQEQDIRLSQEVGFAAHLTKPTSLERLNEAIAAATAAPRVA